MRSLEKNKRSFYYANLIGTESIFDEYGNETGELKKVYGEPVQAYGNVSASIGEEAIATFGSMTTYSRTIALTSNAMKEGSRVWLGVEPTKPHNYVVTKVADSLNGYLLAIQEVNANYD